MILHFDGFYLFDAFDASQISLWGQPAFIYSNNNSSATKHLGFLVKVRTNTRYVIHDTDFTIPSFNWSGSNSGYPNAQSSSAWHDYGQMLGYNRFANQPAPMEVIEGNYNGNDWTAVWNKLDLGTNNVSAKNKTEFIASRTMVQNFVTQSLPADGVNGVSYSAAINGNFFYSGAPTDCSQIVGFEGNGTTPWSCGNPDKSLSNAGQRYGFGINTAQPGHIIERDVDENGGYHPGHTIEQMPYGLNNIGALVLNGVGQQGDSDWPYYNTHRCRSLLVWSKDQKHLFILIIGYPLWDPLTGTNAGLKWSETVDFVKTGFRDAVRKKLPDFDVGDAVMLDGGTSSQLSYRRVQKGKSPKQQDWWDHNGVSDSRLVPTMVHTYATIPNN